MISAGLSSPLRVFCRMSSTGGWIVIQQRKYGNVSFDRRWEEYKMGFGDFDGDFWIGKVVFVYSRFTQQ